MHAGHVLGRRSNVARNMQGQKEIMMNKLYIRYWKYSPAFRELIYGMGAIMVVWWAYQIT